MNSLDTKQTNTRGGAIWKRRTKRERGRDKAGVWPSCLSCLTLCDHCHRTGGPPCVLCRLLFLWPGEARKLVTLGAWGRGGKGPPPPTACWPFHLNPASGNGWGGLGGGASLWVEGKGCWWGAAGWAGRRSREARQGNATDSSPTTSPTPALKGVIGLVLPAPPDPSLFIHRFHVVRSSSSELSLPLREVDAPYDNLLPSHPDVV